MSLLDLIRERYPGDARVIAEAQAIVDATRGDEAALERTRAMLNPVTVAAAAADRRMFERAFLHARRSVDDLTARSYAVLGGQRRPANRVHAGLATARQLGLGRVALVRDFPIALVGYGYSRVHPTPAPGCPRWRRPGTPNNCP